MRAFACDHCRSLVFFENTTCLTCGSLLGFERDNARLVVLDRVEGAPDELGASFRAGEVVLHRCANSAIADCNWLTPSGLCGSCALTRTRPNDADTDALAAFARTEAAKRRLIYQLDSLGLSTDGVRFDLLSSAGGPVTTGHADGLITIDLAEGDDLHREALRVQLAEPYRTLLGHLRHEIGHWYWAELVQGSPFLDRFRDLFGDEQADYAQALAEHYAAGPGSDWADEHVSHYASAHPWEDWAETFAHYLHIRDTMQTAHAWGMRIAGPALDLNLAWNAQLAVDPVEDPETFDELAQAWVALTFTFNAVNRSMGKEDLYPFVLSARVLDKLRFVHVVVTSQR